MLFSNMNDKASDGRRNFSKQPGRDYKQSTEETKARPEKRYQAGLVSYLEVIVIQRTALQAERSITQLQGQQFTTSVLLIKALGGGWQD